MVIYLDEPAACQQWMQRHKGGFVFTGRWRGRREKGVLHRSDCETLRDRLKQKRRSVGNLLACSHSFDEMQFWLAETKQSNAACPDCQPTAVRSASSVGESLTRLGREILDYVVDAAVIHLESPDGAPYNLTVGDVGLCLAKTPAQLAHVLHDLEAGGWLQPLDGQRLDRPPSADNRVAPTAKALKAFALYGDANLSDLEQQLSRLVWT